MNNHIFITHTAFQEFIAEASAINIKKNNPYATVSLASETALKKRNGSIWDNTLQLENLTPSSFGKNKEKDYHKNVTHLKSLLKENTENILYISDIQWPLNNRLYFDKKINTHFEFNMIIDGTLAYYDPHKNMRGYIRDIIKYIAGKIGLGLHYTPYTGSIMGWERDSTGIIYGLDLKLSPIPLKKQINIEECISQTGKLNKNKCIFLDQPYHNSMTTLEVKTLTNDTLSFIEKESLENIHYKAHHFSKEELKNTFNFKKSNILETTECIERIILEHSFGTIISYNSTALFTLKTIYKDKIRCISLRDKKSRIKINPISAKKIDNLFCKAGVEIHEIG